MSSKTINTLIDDFNALEDDEKEMALDIIRKAVAEIKRNSIAANAKVAEENLKYGKVKRGNVDDLFNDLDA
ncbi:MAG: hypothetical protein GC178_14870 [Flavobacteriales bacterium]|nr:hypothetical protein [Flavobacteriales bacterium]